MNAIHNIIEEKMQNRIQPSDTVNVVGAAFVCSFSSHTQIH